MEEFYHSAEGSSTGSTVGSGSGSGSGGRYPWIDAASSSAYAPRRRPMLQFPARAYLEPAFNACAGSPSSSSVGSVDDLLRYSRTQLFPSSSAASDERAIHLRQLLQRRSSLGFSSGSPLSSMGRARTPPGRSPPLYCTPGRGAVMEDGVLVINDGLQGANRVVPIPSPAQRLLELGSYPANNYGGNGNIRNSRGSGGFYREERRRSFGDVGYAYAVEPQQMGWYNQRSRALPNASPAAVMATPGISVATYPTTLAAVRDDDFELEMAWRANRHSPVPGPLAAAAAEEAGPAPWAVAKAKNPVLASAIYTGVQDPAGYYVPPVPTKPAVPSVRTRREEEEGKLHRINSGPVKGAMPRQSSSESTFPWPPTEEQEAEIERVLYGPRRWKRLPVFQQICPEE